MALATIAAAPAVEMPRPDEGIKPAAVEKPETHPATRHDEIRQFASEAGFTKEQEEKLLAEVERYADKMAAWQKEFNDRAAAIRKAATEARMAKDEPALKRVLEEANALTEKNFALNRQHAAAFRNMLTPEQRVAWDAFQLRRRLFPLLEARDVVLTEEQRAKCRTVCDCAAKEAAEAEAKGERALTSSLFVRVIDAVTGQVLTAGQKAAFVAASGGKGPGIGKPDADKPAPDKSPAKQGRPG